MVDHGIVKLPCFAFRFETSEGSSAVFSGDTVPCDAMVELAEGVDLLVHECNFPDEEVETRKQLGYAWYIHSTPKGVAEVARRAAPTRLALNHFVGWNDFSEEHEAYVWEEIAPPVVQPAFDGELIIGHDLLSLEI
jgi:ribonuclease BN (tRNA processing enzyme)